MSSENFHPGDTEPVHAVNLLRFLAAAYVVAYHYGCGFPLSDHGTSATILAGLPHAANAWRWTWAGWIGVEIFFVISGYVIAISANGRSAGDFLRRRVLRLVPATWICATITLGALLSAGAGNPATLALKWVRSITYTPVGNLIDSSYWTLGIELGFYAVVALVVGKRGTVKRIDAIAVVLGLVSGLFWLGIIVGRLHQTSRIAELLLAEHGGFFALGIVIHSFHNRGTTKPRAMMFVMLLAVCIIETWAHAVAMMNQYRIVASVGIPISIFLMAIITLLSAPHLQPLLGTPSIAPKLRMLGLMTFPLYLIHQDAGAALLALLLRIGIGPIPAIILTALTALGVAWVIARFAEPLLREKLRAAIDAVSSRHAPVPDIRPTASPANG